MINTMSGMIVEKEKIEYMLCDLCNSRIAYAESHLAFGATFESAFMDPVAPAWAVAEGLVKEGQPFYHIKVQNDEQIGIYCKQCMPKVLPLVKRYVHAFKNWNEPKWEDNLC